MSVYKLHISNDSNDLADETAQTIAGIIRSVLTTKARCQIALSGGSTPCNAYNLLKDIVLPWEKVDVFLGDERWVPSSNESSNALMLRNTLFSRGIATKARFYEVPVDKFSNQYE